MDQSQAAGVSRWCHTHYIFGGWKWEKIGPYVHCKHPVLSAVRPGISHAAHSVSASPAASKVIGCAQSIGGCAPHAHAAEAQQGLAFGFIIIVAVIALLRGRRKRRG